MPPRGVHESAVLMSYLLSCLRQIYLMAWKNVIFATFFISGISHDVASRVRQDKIVKYKSVSPNHCLQLRVRSRNNKKKTPSGEKRFSCLIFAALEISPSNCLFYLPNGEKLFFLSLSDGGENYNLSEMRCCC